MGIIEERIRPAWHAIRACRLREIYRQFGRQFLVDQLDPVREGARGRDYTLAGMIAAQSVFVHVPKTAGVAVLRALFGNCGMGHMTIREYQAVLRPSYLDRAFVFTVVRNPWDRLFSAYNFLRAGGWKGTRDDAFAAMLRDCPDFEHFVLDYLPREEIRAIDHFVPTLEYLVDGNGEFFPFDFIARYGRLDEDYRVLAALFGVRPRLPLVNATPGVRQRAYLKAYTPRMIDTVARYYGQTIEALGYWFDGYSETIPALERARRRHPGRGPAVLRGPSQVALRR